MLAGSFEVLSSTAFGGDSVIGTFGPVPHEVTAFGLEMEPSPAFPNNPFAMVLQLIGSDGGAISQTVVEASGARFFGWTGGAVSSFVATCFGGCGGFAFGEMVKAEAQAVPEPGTLLLLGSGLVGVVFWRRRATR